MTREKAKELFKKASDFAVHYFDHTDVVSLCQVDLILNEILDEHEAQLKAKDEENERLKEAMQEFVSRVEKGEVRSSYTYSKFKELLKDNQ